MLDAELEEERRGVLVSRSKNKEEEQKKKKYNLFEFHRGSLKYQDKANFGTSLVYYVELDKFKSPKTLNSSSQTKGESRTNGTTRGN